MLSGDYSPQARLRQHLKDVHLILDEAQHFHLALPFSELHCTLLEKAIALNLGDLDNSAIRLLYPTGDSGRQQ
jgi:3-hydroxyisobutyrate dehydrogenase